MANEVTDRITVGVPWSEEAGGGGGIQEVNGYTGPSVQLDASDVGAVPENQFASTAQRGIVQLATDAQALAGLNSQNAMTPSSTRAAAEDRYERSASSTTSLGAGRFAGETALLTVADIRVLIFWNGATWRSVSTRIAGTVVQRDALTSEGIFADGALWHDIDTGDDTIRNGTAWASDSTGWLSLPLAPGFSGSFRYIRTARQVECRFDITGTISSDSLLTDPMPAGFRPSTEVTGITVVNAYVDPAVARPQASIYVSDGSGLRATGGSNTVSRVRGGGSWMAEG